MAKSPYKPYTPNPEQIALKPATSGNAINGLGEKNKRRASPVYWHDPDTLAHGALQKWFYTQDPDNPAINQARKARAKILEQTVPDVSSVKQQRTPSEWVQALSEFVDSVDMDLFGITPMQSDYLFEDAELPGKWIIMIGVAHAFDEIKHAPEPRAGAEVVRQYGRGIKAAKDIATWVRQRGWSAEPHGGPMAGPMLLIPPAIACGFGELGKHGSIINPEFGSSFRLACVVTDLPLEATQEQLFGVDDFCSRCQVCSNACPPEAILPEKQWVRGEEKWYVDFDKCIPFFNEHFGCGICIAVCPFSLPGRAPRILEQLAQRQKKLDSENTDSQKSG